MVDLVFASLSLFMLMFLWDAIREFEATVSPSPLINIFIAALFAVYLIGTSSYFAFVIIQQP